MCGSLWKCHKLKADHLVFIVLFNVNIEQYHLAKNLITKVAVENSVRLHNIHILLEIERLGYKFIDPYLIQSYTTVCFIKT